MNSLSLLETTAIAPACVTANVSLESVLRDLPLVTYQVDVALFGGDLAKIFNHNPLLPGVILVAGESFVGMLSRRRFLELMSRPYGLDLFTKRSVDLLYQFIKNQVLVLSGEMSISQAARQALQRSGDFLYEPVVVKLSESHYGLLDFHQLLVANSRIHELTTHLLNEQTQAKFIQTEKMASLGQMVAGVAHEILNPVNFIYGNVDYLSCYINDLMRLIAVYDTDFPQASTAINQVKEDIDFEFIAQDLVQVIASVKMGAERLQKIIGALRNFSHMDEVNKRSVDLHECLDNTLLILHNRLKHSIQVVKNYGQLPPVLCYSGQLSQVFINLLANAIDALLERAETAAEADWKPRIEIATRMVEASEVSDRTNPWVAISITDNAAGIPPEQRERIFDQFFTTKPVGKGTGFGLAISHQIVTEKHGGQLRVQSQPGRGSTFEVWLPLT